MQVDHILCGIRTEDRVGVGGQRHAQATLPPVKKPGANNTGAWVDPGPVWVGAENLDLTGIRSPNRPARSDSLYLLRYPAPLETKLYVV
jgi:hypothetical protein